MRGTRNGHTTALFADECQSFLDNVIAGLGQIGSSRLSRDKRASIREYH